MIQACRLVVAFLFALAALPVEAQGYPSKPIRLICPFPPAGAVDIASRAIANEMTKSLGQPVAVENRPGAGGNLGAEAAARAAPDGYTLFMSTSGIQAINPALYSKMPVDVNKELVPVAPLVSLNNVLVLHPSVKANSVKDVIALAKAQPGKINYASSGNGTSIHMSGAMFTHLTGVDMIHVPYKGSGPAVTDLLAGQVMMMFDNIPSSLPHIKAGKLKALATTGAKRDPALPDLPTVAEAGVPGYESGVWFGVMVPAGTPKEIVARLNAELNALLKNADTADSLMKQGLQPTGGTPEDLEKLTRTDLERWAKVIRDAKIQPD